MNDAPMFIQGRPRPKTGKALLLTMLIVAVLSVGIGVGGLGTGLGALGILLVVAAATLTLYLVVGRESGDRGGTLDFFILLGTAIGARLLFGGAILAAVLINGAGAGGDYQRVWRGYMDANAADQKALIQEMEAYSPPILLSPKVVSGPAGYRKAREQLADGGKVIDHYRQLALKRQDEAREKLEATVKPGQRARLLEKLNRELAIRQPAEDAYWTLSRDLVAKAIAVADVLERRRATVSDGKFVFRRQADLDAYQEAIDAYNAASDLQRRQGLSNINWERGQNP